MGSIFKAYDIRGIYGEQLTEELAFRVGRAFVTFLRCNEVVVGRDMRPHSEPLFRALCRGLTMQGANVIELGVVSTPMCYFATGSLEADAGIMITASHNTGEYNGFKLCRAGGVPISGATGIQELERIANEESFAPPAAPPGTVTSHDVFPAYREHVRAYADVRRPLRIAVDFANAMGILEHQVLEGLVESDSLFGELDGTFPNHEANPLVPETYASLQAMVRAGDYDFGIAYDGDADRVGFVDETGEIIPMDVATALIAEMMLEKEPGATILYDLRSSRAVKEVIEESGGRAILSRVGHAFIKQQMRDENSVFAGELSGHYYFRDNYFTESSSLAVLWVANLVSEGDQPISALARPVQRYVASGEINSTVADTDAVFARLGETYADAEILALDGVTFSFPDWWFNVRVSNTEPLIRLNLEAANREEMERLRDEVLGLIRLG